MSEPYSQFGSMGSIQDFWKEVKYWKFCSGKVAWEGVNNKAMVTHLWAAFEGLRGLSKAQFACSEWASGVPILFKIKLHGRPHIHRPTEARHKRKNYVFLHEAANVSTQDLKEKIMKALITPDDIEN